MGPYGNKNFKTLLFPQITFKSFQTFSDFSSQWSSQKYLFWFCNLSIRFVTIFFSYSLTWDLNHLWVPKLQNATPSSNHFWIFPNVSWVFFSLVLTKVLFWGFEILCLRVFTIFIWVSMLLAEIIVRCGLAPASIIRRSAVGRPSSRLSFKLWHLFGSELSCALF